jgi:hypothetical protein
VWPTIEQAYRQFRSVSPFFCHPNCWTSSHFCTLLLKVKVKLSLFLTKDSAMKKNWGVEVKLHAFLTSALGGVEWSVSRPDSFTPRERAPGTHWIGGWVGSRTVLEAVVKRKIASPHRESNPILEPDRPARSPALYRLSYHSSLNQNYILEEIKSRLNSRILVLSCLVLSCLPISSSKT